MGQVHQGIRPPIVVTLVDLSDNNGPVDWHRLKAAGIVGSLFSAAPTTAVKTAEGLALASVKTWEGLA